MIVPYYLREVGNGRRLPSVVLGIGIALLVAVFYMTGRASVGLQSAYVLYLSAVSYFALVRAPTMKYATRLSWVPIGYLVAGSASLLWNVSVYRPDENGVAIVNLVNATLLLASGIALAFVVTKREFEIAMTVVACATASLILLALVLHWGDRAGDRFNGNGLHPNWWGSIGYGTACAAAFIRSDKLRYGIFSVALFLCYTASSRGSMLGILILVLMLTSLRGLSPRRSFQLGAAALLALLSFWLFLDVGDAFDFVLNDVFELNNKYRGVGTGFTGREEGWRAATDAIRSSPIFGVGYGSLPGVHNGYLLATGEMGLFGGIFFLALVLRAGFSRVADKRLRAVSVSYVVFMLFAPRTFNLVLGSMIPTLCMMMCLAVHNPVRRNMSN